MLYIVVFILMLIGIAGYDCRKIKSGGGLLYGVIYMILVLIAGLRYRLGTDTMNYVEVYQIIPTLSELPAFDYSETRYDIGYLLISSLIKTLSPEFVWMQLFHAVVVNWVIFYFFRRFTRRSFLAITLYYILYYEPFCMETMRSSLALCFVLMAWPFLLRKRWVPYFALCLVATSIHVSFILSFLVPIFLLSGINSLFVLGKRTFVICCGIIVAGFALDLFYFDIMRPLAFTEGLRYKVETYARFSEGGQVYNWKGLIGFLVRFILYPMIAFILLKRHRLTHSVEWTKLFGPDRNKRGHRYRPVDKKWGIRCYEMMLITTFYIIVASFPLAILYRLTDITGIYLILLVCLLPYSKLPECTSRFSGIFNNRRKWLLVLILWLPLFAANIYPWTASVTGESEERRYRIVWPIYTVLDPHKDCVREAIYDFYIKRE